MCLKWVRCRTRESQVSCRCYRWRSRIRRAELQGSCMQLQLVEFRCMGTCMHRSWRFQHFGCPVIGYKIRCNLSALARVSIEANGMTTIEYLQSHMLVDILVKLRLYNSKQRRSRMMQMEFLRGRCQAVLMLKTSLQHSTEIV